MRDIRSSPSILDPHPHLVFEAFKMDVGCSVRPPEHGFGDDVMYQLYDDSIFGLRAQTFDI